MEDEEEEHIPTTQLQTQTSQQRTQQQTQTPQDATFSPFIWDMAVKCSPDDLPPGCKRYVYVVNTSDTLNVLREGVGGNDAIPIWP